MLHTLSQFCLRHQQRVRWMLTLISTRRENTRFSHLDHVYINTMTSKARRFHRGDRELHTKGPPGQSSTQIERAYRDRSSALHNIDRYVFQWFISSPQQRRQTQPSRSRYGLIFPDSSRGKWSQRAPSPPDDLVKGRTRTSSAGGYDKRNMIQHPAIEDTNPPSMNHLIRIVS